MDTARITIKNKHTCHFCMNYQPKYKNRIKLCRGTCKVTGSYKQRTDNCKKYFKDNAILSFLDD